MEPRRLVDLVLFAVLALPVCAMAAKTPASGAVYRCTVDGKLFIGDTVPKECYNHGWTKRANGVEEIVDSPEVAKQKTEEREREKKAKTEEARRKKEIETMRGLVRDTYSSVADLDNRRNRAVQELDITIKDLEDQIKAGNNSEQAVRNLQELIKARTRDRDETIRRFEEHRKILVEIESEASGTPVKPIEREVLIEAPADSTKK